MSLSVTAVVAAPTPASTPPPAQSVTRPTNAAAPAAPPPPVAAQHAPAAAPAGASKAQQGAALSHLLGRYTYDQSHGADAGTLSALGRQIMAAARGLGRHVTLPQAQASSAPPPAAAPGSLDLRA